MSNRGVRSEEIGLPLGELGASGAAFGGQTLDEGGWGKCRRDKALSTDDHKPSPVESAIVPPDVLGALRTTRRKLT